MNLDNDTVYDYAVEKVYEHVPGPKRNHGNKLNFRAPCCGDSKKSKSKCRGWIFRNNGSPPSFWCYNCSDGSLAIELIAALENKTVGSVKGDILKQNRGMGHATIAAVPITPVKKEAAPKSDDFEIPARWIDLDRHADASTVVKNRKIFTAPNLPKNWKLYYNKRSKRIVLPWTRNNKIVYYQERAIYKKQSPKYLFPKNLEKDIFGLDNVDPNFPFIYVLEGAFDAIFCKNGICCGGTTITAKQNEILRELFDFTPVWLFDNQNIDTAAYNKILKLANSSKGHRFFIWPKTIAQKDINEYYLQTGTNPFFDTDFLQEHTYTSSQAILKLKFSK